MSPEDVVSRVFGIPRSEVSDHTANEALEAWDSMGHINLILEVESVFGITLSAQEALDMTSVGAIKKVLGSHGVTW